MKKLTILVIILSLFNASALATDKPIATMNVKIQTGNFKLQDLINASSLIANATPSKIVDKAIAGEVITLKGKKYEVRFFSFEDTTNKLPKTQTFKEYAQSNKITELASVITTPVPGIIFESFDFRRAKLNDAVYFSMAVRLIEDQK